MTKKRKPPLEYYLDIRYPITLHEEFSGGFVAELKMLPGCITQGDSLEEIYENIKEARTLWIQTAYEHGDEIPEYDDGRPKCSYVGRCNSSRCPRHQIKHNKKQNKKIFAGLLRVLETPGVNLNLDPSIPLYNIDPKYTDLLVRTLNGKKQSGKFIDGVFYDIQQIILDILHEDPISFHSLQLMLERKYKILRTTTTGVVHEMNRQGIIEIFGDWKLQIPPSQETS